MRSNRTVARPVFGLARVGWMVAVPAAFLVAQTLAAAPWATGAGLRKELRQPTDLAWSGNPLRAALGRLAEAKKVAFLIDRRIDPGRKVDLSVRNMPLQNVLKRIAGDPDLGFTMFGPVACFGPPEATARLRTVAALQADALKTLPPEIHQKFFKSKSIKWDDFATPRELLKELAAENQLRIVALEQVPHDLWAGADLPPLSLIDRFMVILNQFDLAFQVSTDGRQMTLIPIPKEVAIVRAYPGGPDPAATAQRYATIAPDAAIKPVDGTIWVKGFLEDHEQIALGKPPAPPAPVDPVGPVAPVGPVMPAPDFNLANKRFTVKVEDTPVGDLIHGLAQRMQLQLSMDQEAIRQAKIDLSELVSFDVNQATAEEVFQAVLKDTPLTFRLNGNVLEVLPKK